ATCSSVRWRNLLRGRKTRWASFYVTDPMSIVKNAVKESRDVARLAVDAAKNELIEQLTPTIQAIIDGRMRSGALGKDVAALKSEGVNRLRQAEYGYDGITDFEEGADMAKKDKDKME